MQVLSGRSKIIYALQRFMVGTGSSEGGGQASGTSNKDVFKENEKVQAKWKPMSHTWKNATVVCVPPGGDPMIRFDGNSDAKQIPWIVSVKYLSSHQRQNCSQPHNSHSH